jgi:WD40 repeat protein
MRQGLVRLILSLAVLTVARPVTPTASAADPLPEGAVARLGSRRLRHAGPVQSVAFSPDGKLLLSTGGDGTIRLWDVAGGRAVRQIPNSGHAAAFSPDGEWLAVAEDGKTIVLHEVSVGKNTRRIGTHDGTVLALAFSPDGKSLAAAGQNATVVVWDVAGAKRKHLLKLPPGTACRRLSFSPDSKLLAAAGSGENARVWDTVTGEERYAPRARDVAFSPDGKLLVEVNLTGAVCLLDATTGQEVAQLPVGVAQFNVTVAFSQDGKHLATAGDDALRLFDVAKREELRRLPSPPGGIHHVAFSPDGKSLAWTGGCAVRVWDVPAWKDRFPPDGHTTQIDALAFSPDGKALASGGTNDNRLLLWDVAAGKERRALDCESQGVSCLAFAPDGKSLAAGLTPYPARENSAVAVWDTATGTRLRRLGYHVGAGVIAFSSDGKLLAANDAAISVWDTDTGRLRATLQPGGQMIHSLAFTPRGRSLLMTSYGLPLGEWDVATGKEVRRFDGEALPHLRMAVSPSGRFVAVGWRYGTDTPKKNPIRIWEVTTGQEVAGLWPDDSMAEGVAFSPDSRLIACLRHDQTIRVADLLTGEELRRFRDPALPTVIAFAPDGKTLASAGWDTTITLWDVKDLTGRKPSLAKPLSAERLAALWSDLDGADGAKGYEAVRALARVPDQAVPLIRERLARPSSASQRIARLIADLDNDDFQVRERASEELEKFGVTADTALRRALADTTSAEVKKRIETLLGRRTTPGVSPEHVVATRALEVLELAGTPEARRLIRSFAEGPDAAAVAAPAREAVERLGR